MNQLNDSASAARTPDEIMDDFDAGCRGQADIDMHAVAWEIMEDVQSSCALAMKEAGVPAGVVASVMQTVSDYLMNHYD
jgi:hypothetical protein